MTTIDPSNIMQVGLGFWASKVLLSAVELGLFTQLATKGKSGMTGEEVQVALKLNPRATFDFLDTLLALGFLERDGNGAGARYRNTPTTEVFLDRNRPEYIGGMLEMANARLWRFWGDLTEGLRTGKPQSEIKHTGQPFFVELYKDPAKLEQFMSAMAGISTGNFLAFAEKFDFSKYKTMLDVGGADGALSTIVAQRHANMRCTSYDLPPVEPIAQRRIAKSKVADRVSTASGDFFTNPLPNADVVVMSHILHDWNLEKKKQLVAAAYKALPPGGAFVSIDGIIDDERRKNAFGLMMSLNMLIEVGDGFDYTGADFAGWAKAAGFKSTEVVPLAGPASAAIAYK
jgi:2-polyprenyl-3-methyl-5-hydroxy-6-metoxy-1,4-benzoquinol methylase